MGDEIPNPELIETIFNNNIQNQSTANLKGNLINEQIKNDEDISNHVLSPSMLSPKGEKKRRPGVLINPFQMEEEKEQQTISNPQVNNNITESEKNSNLSYFNFFEKIKKYENSQTAIIIMLSVIVISLFFYDIRILFLPKKIRKFYLYFYYALFFYYLHDLIFRMLILENLFFTFYFWIDFIACLSMILDLDPISYPFIQNILYPNHNNKYISLDQQSKIELIINMFQILRLLRVIKFYRLLNDIIKEKERQKNINKIMEKLIERKKRFSRGNTIKQSIPTPYNQNMKEGYITTNFNVNQSPEGYIKSPQRRTNIFRLPPLVNDKKWEEDTRKELQKRVFKIQKINLKVTEGILILMIFIVILVFLIAIYLDDDNYHKESFAYILMCKYINIYVFKKNIQNCTFVKQFVNDYLLTNVLSNLPIIQVEWKDFVIYQNLSMDLNLKHYYRRDISYIYSKDDNSTVIIISKKETSKMISIMFIFRIVYIILSVSILCFLINNDIYQLIFHPLEKIGKVVDIVSKDPVGSKTITELKNNYEHSSNKKEDPNSVSYEIKIIQSAIIRISALIAINFGEAGGEILKENISSSEGLNPMLKGKRIQAIFGFCFIHNFSEINEAFQEKTMIFVNQISDIVHSCVDKFNGITNKNLGDCYLLAWKFKEKTKKINENNYNSNYNNNNINTINTLNHLNTINNNDGKLSLKNSNITEDKNTELADCALLGFLNIIKKINKSQNILAYRKNSDLIKKFGPKYSVQMGFGLHTGWGIEGAIGSYYKIDCSYLSPNVNIAARLETATNIYGVDILFSGEFYDLLSDFMKRKCRKIDVVTLKGSEKPVTLYTVDLNKNIHPGKMISKKDRLTLRERRAYYALKKKKLWHKYNTLNYKYSLGEIYLKQSKGLRELLKHNKSELFYNCFYDGFNDYIDGEWKEAAQFLEKARYLDKSDGPTKTILDYIKSLNLEPPNNWDGYRVLTSKT